MRMIAIVWLISLLIASPILAGINDTPDREVNHCAFNNQKFLVYSSVVSFYIPTTVMILLYYKIFIVIRSRAKIAKLRNSSSVAISFDKNNEIKKDGDNNATTGYPTKQFLTLNSTQENSPNLIEKEQTQNRNFFSGGIFTFKNSTITRDRSNSEFHITKETHLDEKNQQIKNEIMGKSRENINLDKKIVSLLDKETKSQTKSKNKVSISFIGAISNLPSTTNHASSNREKKVTKTLAIVVIVFLVCW